VIDKDKELYYQSIAGTSMAGLPSLWQQCLAGVGFDRLADSETGSGNANTLAVVDLAQTMPQGDTDITRSGDSVMIKRYDVSWVFLFQNSPGAVTTYGVKPIPYVRIEYFLCEVIGTNQTVPTAAAFGTAHFGDFSYFGRNKKPEFFDTKAAVGATKVARRAWKILRHRIITVYNPALKWGEANPGSVSASGATPTTQVVTYGNDLFSSSGTDITSRRQWYESWPMPGKGRKLTYNDGATGAVAAITQGRQFLMWRGFTPPGS